jgi:hypothetical protein
MECKRCGDEIPLRDEYENEPEAGGEYFVWVRNPEEDTFVTKEEDFFCSVRCLIEFYEEDDERGDEGLPEVFG